MYYALGIQHNQQQHEVIQQQCDVLGTLLRFCKGHDMKIQVQKDWGFKNFRFFVFRKHIESQLPRNFFNDISPITRKSSRKKNTYTPDI